jgi:hypothetical protein
MRRPPVLPDSDPLVTECKALDTLARRTTRHHALSIAPGMFDDNVDLDLQRPIDRTLQFDRERINTFLWKATQIASGTNDVWFEPVPPNGTTAQRLAQLTDVVARSLDAAFVEGATEQLKAHLTAVWSAIGSDAHNFVVSFGAPKAMGNPQRSDGIAYVLDLQTLRCVGLSMWRPDPPQKDVFADPVSLPDSMPFTKTQLESPDVLADAAASLATAFDGMRPNAISVDAFELSPFADVGTADGVTSLQQMCTRYLADTYALAPTEWTFDVAVTLPPPPGPSIVLSKVIMLFAERGLGRFVQGPADYRDVIELLIPHVPQTKTAIFYAKAVPNDVQSDRVIIDGLFFVNATNLRTLAIHYPRVKQS